MLIGMSQVSLGEALGVTFQQIQKYERGANRIGAGRLQQLSTVLGVPIPYFFEGHEENGPGLRTVDAPPLDYVTGLLMTSEGLQLVKAFTRISNAKVRRRFVELLVAAADLDEPSLPDGV